MSKKNFLIGLAALCASQLLTSAARPDTYMPKHPPALAPEERNPVIDRVAAALDARDIALMIAVRHREEGTVEELQKIVEVEIPQEFIDKADQLPDSRVNLRIQESIVAVSQGMIKSAFADQRLAFDEYCVPSANSGKPVCEEFLAWLNVRLQEQAAYYNLLKKPVPSLGRQP